MLLPFIEPQHGKHCANVEDSKLDTGAVISFAKLLLQCIKVSAAVHEMFQPETEATEAIDANLVTIFVDRDGSIFKEMQACLL